MAEGGRYYTVPHGRRGFMIRARWCSAHFAASFYRAMTLLVVASPCALVIATPATILSAIANAARNGILFKGGRFIEALGRVKAVAFDKTGTLTHGRFEVTDVFALDGASEAQVVEWAASAETRSQHPLAQAVVRAAEARGIRATPAEQLTSVPGKGLVARTGGETIEIGTPELFTSEGVTPPAAALERIEALRREAKTAMLVRRGTAWGVIAAADQLRPSAAQTVADLRRNGIRATVLISGDNSNTVEAIAREVKVDEYYGSLLPEDKVHVIGELEKRHGAVAMVGDGVNDAPALARATVGVAMGLAATRPWRRRRVRWRTTDGAAYALPRSRPQVVIQNVTIATA